MLDTTSLLSEQRVSRVTRYAYGILLLTSVHHAYGAHIYTSPWRLHVVALAIAAAAVIGIAAKMFQKRRTGTAAGIAFWILVTITLAFPFAMIGFFEGGYNHLLKDALYFGGASRELMRTLFPAPAYEMPSSFFFELTGVAQVVPAAMGGGHLYGLVRDWRDERNNRDVTIVASQQHSWR
jgi:hypothetical protein